MKYHLLAACVAIPAIASHLPRRGAFYNDLVTRDADVGKALYAPFALHNNDQLWERNEDLRNLYARDNTPPPSRQNSRPPSRQNSVSSEHSSASPGQASRHPSRQKSVSSEQSYKTAPSRQNSRPPSRQNSVSSEHSTASPGRIPRPPSRQNSVSSEHLSASPGQNSRPPSRQSAASSEHSWTAIDHPGEPNKQVYPPARIDESHNGGLLGNEPIKKSTAAKDQVTMAGKLVKADPTLVTDAVATVGNLVAGAGAKTNNPHLIVGGTVISAVGGAGTSYFNGKKAQDEFNGKGKRDLDNTLELYLMRRSLGIEYGDLDAALATHALELDMALQRRAIEENVLATRWAHADAEADDIYYDI